MYKPSSLALQFQIMMSGSETSLFGNWPLTLSYASTTWKKVADHCNRWNRLLHI